MRIVAASLWAVLVVVGWACPLMAGCFYGDPPAAQQACHRSSDDSQPAPEDCPYQIQATSPAESRFEAGFEAFVAFFSHMDLRLSAPPPASQITPLMPPVIDGDYFRKLTILLV